MTTQDAHSAAADHHRRVLEHAPFPLISTGEHHNIQSINAAACKLFQEQPQNVIGQPIIHMLSEDMRDTMTAALTAAIQNAQKTEFLFNRPNNPNALGTTVCPITDDHNKPVAALVTIREITQRIDPATNNIQRTKLAYLGRMAGAFAHYFNNILGGAVTSVSYALSSDDADLQAKTLKHTNDALARATKLLDSLLSFAEGDQRHSSQSELTELIHDVASYVGPELARQNITLDLKLEPIPKTLVPQMQIITVLENIIHNAADATESGGNIVVSTRRDSDSVTLSVTDTGCGIAEAQLPHIFEPFFSTKSDVNADFEHHPGLGLAVAHGLLQVLGHTISVQSTTDEGTTVTIRFEAATTPTDPSS